MKRIRFLCFALAVFMVLFLMQSYAMADDIHENAVDDDEITLEPLQQADAQSVFDYIDLKCTTIAEGSVRIKNYDVDPESGRICVSYYGAGGFYDNGMKSWAFIYDSNGSIQSGWSVECNSYLTVSWINGYMYAFISKTDNVLALYDDGKPVGVYNYSLNSYNTSLESTKRQMGEWTYELKASGLFSGYDMIERSNGKQTVCVIDCSSQKNSSIEMLIGFACLGGIIVLIVFTIVRKRKRQSK